MKQKYICPLATDIPDKLDAGNPKPLVMTVIVGHALFTSRAFEILFKYHYHNN
jgi:hypothetical protein